jgi:tetratricopeptide (TPR) repeat protein
VENTRRELILIAGGTLTAALLSWLIADPAAAGQVASGRSIGEAAVARLEERASTLRRSYTSGHGARLYAVASDLARQRAAALFDVRGECADGAFETALRAAKAAGDDPLGANCLAFWANAAYNTGRPRDAEAMASTALAAVRGRTTPRVQAMLESRRGRARARLGDPACWASFDTAEQLLSQADGHADPDWAYWFDLAEVYGARASSHLDLGQPALAEADFTTARGLFDPSIIRTQALYLTRQAIAQADQGHIDQAADTGSQALDVTQSISSSRATSLLADLASILSAHQTASTQEFCERARAVLTD